MSAPDEHGWRDIASAPKDGTHFLACHGPYSPNWGFNQSPPVVVHYWGNPGEEGFYLSNGRGVDDQPYRLTHWMPLPQPPHGATPTTVEPHPGAATVGVEGGGV